MIIGLGIDIVDIGDFRKRLNDALIEELFLPDEAAYALSMSRPWEHLAGRFAAKEAAFKALGAGLSEGLRWHDAEVCRLASGNTELSLHGEALRLADEKGISAMHLSLSHTKSAAVAVVVMEQKTRA